MKQLFLPARYYQQFDTDPSLEVPGEGYGGWKAADIPIAPEHTALVVMHAWHTGSPRTHPGWWRSVEYLPRARKILEEVFPPLLKWARQTMTVMHVVGGPHDYYSHLPGYQKALRLSGGAGTPAEQIAADATYRQLEAFRADHVFVGPHNRADVDAGYGRLDFAPSARPLGDEGIAENGEQLFALCKEKGVNHLIYVGFAINWCLLMSPGGMIDMRRHGLLCSTIAEAVTAVENKETARQEREKTQALWRVALEFGFVFEVTKSLSAPDGAERPPL